MKKIILSFMFVSALSANPMAYFQEKRSHAQTVLKQHDNNALASLGTLAFNDIKSDKTNLVSLTLSPLMTFSQVSWNLLINPILLIPDNYLMILPAATHIAIMSQINAPLLIILSLGLVMNNNLHAN